MIATFPSAMTRRTLIAVAATLALAASTMTLAADAPFWPVFHGPNGDNKSTDTGLLTEWPEGGPKLLWTTDGLGEGYSGVTLADGRIFTTGNIDEKSRVFALDLNGDVLWTYDNGPAWTKSYPGTRSTPTVDGDRVYDFSPVGQVVCLDAKTGEKKWDLNVFEQYGGEQPTWALAASVKIDGDKLYVAPCGKQASIVALDKNTGKEIWAAAPFGDAKAGYGTPVVCEQDGLRMVLTMSGKALIAVNADNGEQLFSFPHATNYDVNATDPICEDGKIFITSGYGTTGSKLLKLTVDGAKASVEELWHQPKLDNQHGGVVLLDGNLYGSAHQAGRGEWICVDWATGDVKHSDRGVGQGSLTFADGLLYTMGEKRGDIGLVRPTPEKHDMISQFQIPQQGKGKAWAHPVVIGGRLYIRHGEYLYCYDVAK